MIKVQASVSKGWPNKHRGFEFYQPWKSTSESGFFTFLFNNLSRLQ